MSIYSYYITYFFCNEPAHTEIDTYSHTLSLHDALPISGSATGPGSCGTGPRRTSGAARCHTAPRRAPERAAPPRCSRAPWCARSEEHTSELQSLMRISYAVFCLKKKKKSNKHKKISSIQYQNQRST